MKVKLIEALDYNRLNDTLKEYIGDDNDRKELINKIKMNELKRHSDIVSTAGRLSRFRGNVNEVLGISENKNVDANNCFISKVVGMGHNSITDHDYMVFTLEDVSVIIEQIIIEERIASFTIKSRREVDFSNSGYYIPDFHDKDGNILVENDYLKKKYVTHVDNLFKNYSKLVDNGVIKEDARFVLPYSFYSNIIMGVDVHTLADLIIKFTRTKYSKNPELKEFGEQLYRECKDYVPYIDDIINKVPYKTSDSVLDYLNEHIEKDSFKIIDKVKLLNNSDNIDQQIITAAIMRRYQYDYNKALCVYNELCKDEKNKYEIMKKIAFESDKLELSQVNFEYQIPVSYAILTHLTRHRTHDLVIPDFSANMDLTQYKIPPKLTGENLLFYKDIYKRNKEVFDYFKSCGVRDEDLIYFIQSGNMTNILTNINGWTLEHILRLRECNKAQWETRNISHGMHDEIKKLDGADAFESILGPTCETRLYCGEGKESCGKIKALVNSK